MVEGNRFQVFLSLSGTLEINKMGPCPKIDFNKVVPQLVSRAYLRLV